jgi:hypothetical protein
MTYEALLLTSEDVFVVIGKSSKGKRQAMMVRGQQEQMQQDEN